MKMKGLPLLISLVAVATAQEFQGCFKNLKFTNGISREFRGFNLNSDCASFCASQGYILAATHAAWCHCTNTVPKNFADMVSSPRELKLLEGTADSPCNLPCPGTLAERGQCLGDECCGGLIRRRLKRYSLYAVGGIDPVKVFIHRIYQSLLKREHPWLDVDLKGKDPTCHSNFSEVTVAHGFLKFDEDQHSIMEYRRIRSVATVEACQQKCRDVRGCQSITYYINEKECIVNQMSSLTGQITMSERESVVFDRNCTHLVEVLPTSFQMDVVRQSVSEDSAVGGTLEENVDMEDIEVDLTESSEWETTHRSVTVSTSDEISESTQTGFITSRSKTKSSEQSRTDSSTHSSSSRGTWGIEAGFGFSVGGSASVGFKKLGASVEAEASADLQTSVSNTNEESSSTTHTNTETKGQSKSSSVSEKYNYGNTRTAQHSSSQSYEYSMNVPAYHKGHMGFFVKKEPLTRKIVTDLRLNGYLKLKIHNGNTEEERDVHVARVLSPRERFISVLTEQYFQRKVLLAKITMTDHAGNPVTDENQIVERGNK